jgi:ABC-2 type transport system permease protein
MSAATLILRTKYRIINNHLHDVRKHIVLHLVVGLGILFVLIGGTTGFFYAIFDFLMRQEVFGPPLMNRLFGMMMLAFFSMLTFSNLIVTLTTTYISRDLEFYMSNPISTKDIFLVKFVESVIYSSWAFIILSFPLFVAFGAARGARLTFYLFAGLLVIPFVVIPAALGAIATMLISAYLPARRIRKYSIIVAAALIAIMVALMRLMGFQSVLLSANITDFSQIMNLLKLGATPLLPHYWLTMGTVTAASGNWKEYCYWLLLLVSTALMSLQACYWLIPRLYYKGWCLARDSASASRTTSRWSPFVLLDRVLKGLRAPIRAIVLKDFKVFWRDPAQWSQLLILFGLLFIYMANLRGAAQQSGAINLLIPKWKVILSFFNLGATSFILSILSTRFVYPLLSLEGRQFWVLGLAPVRRDTFVWEKYWVSWFASFLITESLMIFSCFILRVSAFLTLVSLGTIFLMSFALTSLAVGLGALTPNFREDNPARIANGLGGTLDVILSLIYLGLVIALEAIPVYLHETGALRLLRGFYAFVPVYIVLLGGLNILAIVLPMHFGLRKWRQIEF